MAKNRLARQLAAAKQELARFRRTSEPVPSANGLPQSAHGVARISQTEMRMTAFSGPLPPPALLAKFDEIVPGAAAQIIAQVHRQSEHRMELEREVILGENGRANCGLYFAGGLAALTLACGTWLIATGHDAAGATLVSVDLVGLVTAFITGTVNRRRERQQKAITQAMVQAGK